MFTYKKFGRLITGLVLLLLVSIFITGPAAAQTAAPSGFQVFKEKIPAPDVTLQDTEGNKVKLTDYRGKLVLLFFWTTW